MTYLPDNVGSMFSGAGSALGALAGFAAANNIGNSMAGNISGGFSNALLGSTKPPVLNGTRFANSINSAMTPTNATSGGATMISQLKTLNDTAMMIVGRIETTNSLLQKMIDIDTGKVNVDVNKIAARNNRISLAMSRTAMGRLAMAVMSKNFGKNSAMLDQRLRGAMSQGLISSRELMMAETFEKMFGKSKIFQKFFSNMSNIANRALKAKDVFTNETNISITKTIPNKLEAIGKYIKLATISLDNTNKILNFSFIKTTEYRNTMKKMMISQIELLQQIRINTVPGNRHDRKRDQNKYKDTDAALLQEFKNTVSDLSDYNKKSVELLAKQFELSRKQQQIMSLDKKGRDKYVIEQAAREKESIDLQKQLLDNNEEYMKLSIKQHRDLMGFFATKMPQMLSRLMTSLIKGSLFLGLGRMLFSGGARLFGNSTVGNALGAASENMTGSGVINIGKRIGAYISEFGKKLWNSETGVKIRESIRGMVDSFLSTLKNYAITMAGKIFTLVSVVMAPKYILRLAGAAVKGMGAAAKRIHTSLIQAGNEQAAAVHGIRGFIGKTYQGVAGTMGAIGGFINKGLGIMFKSLNWIGIGALLFQGIKSYFNTWKAIALTPTEQQSMSMKDQVAAFVKDTIGTLFKGIKDAVVFAIKNLPDMAIGLVKGVWDALYGMIAGDSQATNETLKNILDEDRKEREQKKESISTAIEETGEKQVSKMQSFIDVFRDGLGSLKDAMSKGFDYVKKIFEVFKPRTLGGTVGTLKGGLVQMVQAFMDKDSAKAWQQELMMPEIKRLEGIVQQFLKDNPDLRGKLKTDQFWRVTNDSDEDALRRFDEYTKGEFRFGTATGFIDMMHAPKKMVEETKTLKTALQMDNARTHQLLALIHENTHKMATSLAPELLTGEDSAFSNYITGNLGKTGELIRSTSGQNSNISNVFKNLPKASDIKKFGTNSAHIETLYKSIYGTTHEPNTRTYVADYSIGSFDFDTGTKLNPDQMLARLASNSDYSTINDTYKKILASSIYNKGTINAWTYASLFDSLENQGTLHGQKSISYYMSMKSDFDSIINTYRNALASYGVDPDDETLGDIQPGPMFRDVFMSTLANTIKAQSYGTIYKDALRGSSSQRDSMVRGIMAQAGVFGSLIGNMISKHQLLEQLNKNTKSMDDLDRIGKIQSEYNASLNTFNNFTKAYLSKPLDLSQTNIDALLNSILVDNAVTEQGDDIVYGDWRNFSPNRFNDWRDTIYLAAARVGVEPELISAMIQQESGGRVNAKSGKNAYGLMQLRDPAVIDASKQLGVAPGTYSKYTPEDNVMLGASYLAYMLKLGGGNVIDALRIYNYGMGNMRKWRDKGANLADLPKEAREYPGKVLQYYGKYKFTTPGTPINQYIYNNVRNQALSEAGLGGSSPNVSQYKAISDTNPGSVTGSINSDHAARARAFLSFNGTNISKFMKVNPIMREPFLRYAEDMYNTYGRKVMVTSTYRSFEDQQRLWDNRHNNPNLVGRPNPYNKHNLGLAIDISSRDGYSINDPMLKKYGLIRPFGAKDPVHVEHIKWKDLRGEKLVNAFGNYPKGVGAKDAQDIDRNLAGGTSYSPNASMGSGNTGQSVGMAPSSTGNPLADIINNKFASYGIDTSISDGFTNALQLMKLAGDDPYYGSAEPINYTGLTAGLRNTTFENEIGMLRLAGLSNAEANKIVKETSSNSSNVQSKLMAVMELLAKKTIENNKIMRTLVSTANTTNNLISVSNSNSNTVANNGGNGGGNPNSADTMPMYTGNDMGLRALYT